MSDYIFWKTSDGSIMVEVYSTNFVRIAQVQKELIDQGTILHLYAVVALIIALL